MAHVGDATLADIHEYILLISNRVMEKQAKPKFKGFRRPKRDFPYITRTYRPFTSPASISVSLSPALSVVWDSSIASLRYAYPTSMQMSGEKNREENRKQILYMESANVPFSFIRGQKIDFKGYDLIDGNPEFIYQVGKIKVREKISLGKTAKSFVRHFIISGLALNGDNERISLDLNHQKHANIKVSKGTLTNNILQLTATEAAEFSVEVSL
ncbi:hypothetical protein RS130_01985 [Paraglaciecola aquimarina]|uniref:Uncharacterized protein n=1 Tax=Paraglaciecola aquimarina TaxID=1235557 RepID=A0ABU3SS92_9ALTE|nr:hypothetical protein [Paraglaciecola aquimarina]MDU0352855.1 hypothetical protein [Paraglaciecola aquimarina]